jgi:ABC-type antimicrobial peptide transport system permease subunit
VAIDLDILRTMELFSQAIMFLGLIFDMIVLLFIVLSVLLIYSLLLISVESKSFEYGVMRMQGLSKSGLIYMIVLQSVMFVLPSLLIGFAVSIPTLAAIN